MSANGDESAMLWNPPKESHTFGGKPAGSCTDMILGSRSKTASTEMNPDT